MNTYPKMITDSNITWQPISLEVTFEDASWWINPETWRNVGHEKMWQKFAELEMYPVPGHIASNCGSDQCHETMENRLADMKDRTDAIEIMLSNKELRCHHTIDLNTLAETLPKRLWEMLCVIEDSERMLNALLEKQIVFNTAVHYAGSMIIIADTSTMPLTAWLPVPKDDKTGEWIDLDKQLMDPFVVSDVWDKRLLHYLTDNPAQLKLEKALADISRDKYRESLDYEPGKGLPRVTDNDLNEANKFDEIFDHILREV